MVVEATETGIYHRVLTAIVQQRAQLPASGGLSIAQCADQALELFRELAGSTVLAGHRGSILLTERSVFLPLATPSTSSANGSCKLMASGSGMLAINLAREEDWSLLPAWLQWEQPISDWETLRPLVAARCGVELTERARLMGLPVAPLQSVPGDYCYAIRARGKSRSPVGTPLVVDLSALWAGPLCTHLLQQAGARVIKVESRSRPDSTRFSAPEFHQLLNGGKSTARKASLLTLRCQNETAIPAAAKSASQVGSIGDSSSAPLPKSELRRLFVYHQEKWLPDHTDR